MKPIYSTSRDVLNTISVKKRELTVVISKYMENIEWIFKLKYKSIVYNKNCAENDLFYFNLPNVGREAHTFFTHIVENYNELSEYTAFLQGNPFDHCPEVVEEINNFNFDMDFKPLGTIIYHTSDAVANIPNQINEFAKKIGFDLVYPVPCIRGAQYIASKKIIQQRPVEFYKKILSCIDGENAPFDIYNVEKTLFQIYAIYEW